jgi:hypothetical protein
MPWAGVVMGSEFLSTVMRPTVRAVSTVVPINVYYRLKYDTVSPPVGDRRATSGHL